jgi:putative transferase (TIGR04331 family)
MLLGPWLLTYVAIAWDRWESLRLAFAEQDFVEVHCLSLNRDLMVPKDYDVFKVSMTDDHWNHHLFTEIIRYHYADQLSIYNLDQEDSIDVNIRFSKKGYYSEISKLILITDKILANIQNNYKVVFVESFFDRRSLLTMCLKLKQLPRRHYEFFQSINYPKVNQDRYHRSIDVQPTTDFEGFFQQHIFSQIPIAYLEGYAELNRVAGSIKTTGDVIFTANAHLDNDLFNCWAGDQVEKGKKLVASQHGGAIRSNYTNFDHQEKIADRMVVWHKPYMDQHVQLTPNKMIGLMKIKNETNQNLILLGSETCRYSYRAQAGAYGQNYTEDYNQKIEFCKALSPTVYEYLKVRSQQVIGSDDGWIKSKDRYARDLGQDKISKYPTLREAFAHSKLIVCTYPQTTFIEAMHSNVPTILLYSEEHWPLHPQFDDLIEDLKTNNIIFTDPVKAAEHVNAVWNDPDQWWLDAETQKAVNHFFEMCGKVSDDWVDEWTDFFRSEN